MDGMGEWMDVRRRALRSSSRLDSTERAPAGCTDSSIHYSFAERYAVRVRVIVCVISCSRAPMRCDAPS